MRIVMVLATGGTIATRSDTTGRAVARAGGAELVERSAVADDIRVKVHDVFRVGSYLMTLERMRELAARAQRYLREDDVTGLVITHGTDTMEETALSWTSSGAMSVLSSSRAHSGPRTHRTATARATSPTRSPWPRTRRAGDWEH